MRKLSYLLFVVTVLMVSLSACGSKEGDDFEIIVDNSKIYAFDANGQLKLPFEVYPSDAKLIDLKIRCMSYTKRINDPANTTTLKTLATRVRSIEMDPNNPGNGRLAVINIVDANNNIFVPNSAYFYKFDFKANYLYKDGGISNDFAMEYSYGVEPTRR